MNNNLNANNPITASQLLEYLFCPRFIYYENVLSIPQNEESRFKVQKGRNIHERVRKINPDYLRKKIRVQEKNSDVYLTSTLGIRGIIDEILFLEDGTASPLDYKFEEYKDKIFKTYKYQLVFYGILIQENYDLPVNKGFLVYTRSKNRLIQIDIELKDYNQLKKYILEIQKVIQNGYYPKPTSYKARCADCCYKNICEQVI